MYLLQREVSNYLTIKNQILQLLIHNSIDTDIKDLMEKHEATQRLVYRLLEEVKVLQNSRVPAQENAKSLSILPRETFLSKEEFMSFEKKIQSSEEYFSNLVMTNDNISKSFYKNIFLHFQVKELKEKVSGNASKFIRSCWRRLMKDDVAQCFCWQGAAAKLPLKSLSITLAIKRKEFKRHSFSVSHLFTFLKYYSSLQREIF